MTLAISLIEYSSLVDIIKFSKLQSDEDKKINSYCSAKSLAIFLKAFPTNPHPPVMSIFFIE